MKAESVHYRRLSSGSQPGSAGSVATIPSPSSTPSSHQSSKNSNLNPGAFLESGPASDGIESAQEDDDTTAKENGTSEKEEEPIDRDSMKGIFGWDTVDETSIPYLLRRGKKFVSVRIVECKLLSKYPNTIPEELARKDPLVSLFITEAEANLLNEINTAHCDYEYGHTPFTIKDLVVDLEEFLEFFKIVKKNFPEDMLASMKSEIPTPDAMPQTPPAVPESSQYCGWVQINNTVSPYIVRSDSGKEQMKLVPLSVIVYAAGLLTGSRIEGILPTIEECTMLNAACKTAGFDFSFGRNTRLIAITEVVQRCQVQIFELPMSNPLQFAQYLDGRGSQQQQPPPPSSILTSALRHPPPYPTHMVQYGNPMTMESNMLQNSNPFNRRFPSPRSMMGAPSHMAGASGPPNINISRIPPPNPSGMSFDSKAMSASMHSVMAEKLHNFDKMMPPGNSHFQAPPMWPFQIPAQPQPQPPPAHKPPKGGMLLPHGMPPPSSASTVPPSSSSSSSSSSSYHPHSLPPSPLLHSTSTSPNLSLPIYRNSLPRKDARDPSMTGNRHSLPRPPQAPQHPPPPHSQYSTPSSPSFGVNQFNSSLFARTESHNSHHRQKPPTSSPSQFPSSSSLSTHSTYHHQNRGNVQHPPPFPSSHISNSNSNNNPAQNSKNTQNLLVKNIAACLVNGKSISCLNMDSLSRKGKYCLVEAVSKLYFPTVPILEFVKVLQAVLKAKLYECTPAEETAFVQYYNLPVPKLKCNQMIMVDDLQSYFPQLNYIFSKQSPSVENPHDDGGGGVKRSHGHNPLGPPAKQNMPKLENLVQKLHHDRRPSAGDGGPSSGGASSSVIIIDD